MSMFTSAADGSSSDYSPAFANADQTVSFNSDPAPKQEAAPQVEPANNNQDIQDVLAGLIQAAENATDPAQQRDLLAKARNLAQGLDPSLAQQTKSNLKRSAQVRTQQLNAAQQQQQLRQAELDLQSLQAQSFREKNLLKQEQLQQQIQEAALKVLQLEQGGATLDTDLEVNEEAENVAADELVSMYGQDVVNGVLQSAGNSLAEDVIEVLNAEGLQADQASAYAAFGVLQAIKADPSMITDTPKPWSYSLQTELIDTFGQENGQLLSSMAYGIEKGTYSKADAIRFLAVNPTLQQAALQAARSGMYRLPIGKSRR